MSELTSKPRSLLDRILYSPVERRLRAGWRLVGQGVLLLVFSLLFAILLGWALLLKISPELKLFVQQVISFLAITLSVYLARRALDRRNFASLGLIWSRQAARDLLAGAAIPLVMMGLVFLVEYATGWLIVDGFAWQEEPPVLVLGSALIMLASFALTGWSEELFSRGYHLQNLADGLTLFWGVLLSSAIFAALHYANPSFGASLMPFVGLFASGLFLAYGYLRTRQLWLSIGLHLGWNFFEGPVFGFPVSGLDTFHLVRHTVTGPALLTGGKFGPEAGLLLLPALVVGALLVYFYTRDRNVERGIGE